MGRDLELALASGVCNLKIFIRRIYILGLLFVLIGGFNTFLGIRHLEGELRREIERSMSFKLDHIMSEITSELTHVDRTLHAGDILLGLEPDDDQALAFFYEILGDNPSFLSMYFGISQNESLYANRRIARDNPVDPSTRPWYQKAVQEGKTIITSPYLDALETSYVLTMARPIYDHNHQLIGVLGIDKSLEGMLAFLETERASEHGHSFIFDKTGTILVHPEQSTTYSDNKPLSINSVIATQLLVEPAGMIFTNIHDRDGYLRWETLGASGLILGTFAPLSDFFDRWALIIQVLGITVFSFGLVTLLLFIFQRNFIIRPMKDIYGDIMAISLDGDVTYRLPTRNNHPFETLRETINMSLEKTQEHFEHVIYQQEELTAAYAQLVAHEQQLQAQYEEIKEHEAHIQYLADHDALTGLLNRRRYELDLQALLETGQVGCVFMLDIDDFKNINDTQGHMYGDRILQHVAKILEKSAGLNATVYRFGGDEFLIIMENMVDTEDIRHLAELLARSLSGAQTMDGRPTHITSSMGVVRYPYDGSNVEELLIKADIAMYNAKKTGKNRHTLFEGSMAATFGERVHIERILLEAIQTEGFMLLYQPIVETTTGEIVYFEALIRLQGHLISPTVFIAIAEESNLIHPIGRWVIKEAIGQVVRWKKAGKGLKPISINLSPKQFYDDGLVDFLSKQLKEQGVDPALVEMEITETVLIDNATEAIKIIEKIRALGIKMALDDFGTGYSSINYITRIPVDRIKLDRSMTQELIKNIPVMEGLITIAHGLGMQVVAEGVEKIEEAHLLGQVRCDYLQGYLFSRPVPPEQTEVLLDGDYRGLLGLPRA